MLEHRVIHPETEQLPGPSVTIALAESAEAHTGWWPATRQRVARFLRIQIPQHAYLGDRPGWDRQD